MPRRFSREASRIGILGSDGIRTIRGALSTYPIAVLAYFFMSGHSLPVGSFDILAERRVFDQPAIRSATRNFALRARGLRFSSRG